MTMQDLICEKNYIASFEEGSGNKNDKIRALGRTLTYLSENPSEDPEPIQEIFVDMVIPKLSVKECHGDIIPAFADKFNCQAMDVTIKTVVDYLLANWVKNYNDTKTYIILRGILYQCEPSSRLTFGKTAKIIDIVINSKR